MLKDSIHLDHSSSESAPGYDDWETCEPTLADLTLEEVVRRGETSHDREGNYTYVTLNACPWWLSPVVAVLKGRHQNIRSESAVERHLTKLGLAILSREPELRAIERAKGAFASGEPQYTTLLMFTARTYHWGHSQSRLKGRRRSCSLYRWVDGLATECASVLNLPKAPVVTLGLMYGASRSKLWVPKGYRDVAVAEIEHFRRWLTEWWISG